MLKKKRIYVKNDIYSHNSKIHPISGHPDGLQAGMLRLKKDPSSHSKRGISNKKNSFFF